MRAFLLLIFVSIGITFASHPAFSYDINDSLMAYWSFDDSTATDFSGHGYHGTLMNNPKPVAGVKGSAFWFCGGNYEGADGGHIVLPMIDFNSMNEFSVSLWVNEEDMITYHGDAYIFFGDWQGGYLGILNHYDNYDFYSHDLYLSFCVGARDERDPTKIIVKYDTAKYRHDWIMYTLVYKDGFLQGYINGQLVGTTYQKVSVYGNHAGLGRHWWYDGVKTATRFRGAMDEVRIYNRALDSNEVKFLFKPHNNNLLSIDSDTKAEVFPNPSPTGHLTISYTLDKESFVDLKIYDLAGHELASLVNETQNKGSYKPYWDGSRYGNGVYYYNLIVDGRTTTGRIILNR